MIDYKDLRKLLTSHQVHSQQIKSREDEQFMAMVMQNGRAVYKATLLFNSLVMFQEAEMCCGYCRRQFVSAASLGVSVLHSISTSTAWQYIICILTGSFYLVFDKKVSDPQVRHSFSLCWCLGANKGLSLPSFPLLCSHAGTAQRSFGLPVPSVAAR